MVSFGYGRAKSTRSHWSQSWGTQPLNDGFSNLALVDTKAMASICSEPEKDDIPPKYEPQSNRAYFDVSRIHFALGLTVFATFLFIKYSASL